MTDAFLPLVENMPTPLAVLSASGEILQANRAARELLGDVESFARTELGRHIRAAGLPAAGESGGWSGSVPLGGGGGDVRADLYAIGPGPEGPYGLQLTPVAQAAEADDRVRLLASVIEQSTEFVSYHGPIGAEARINPAGAALVGGGIQPDQPLPGRVRDLFTDDSRRLIREVGVPAMERAGSWRARIQLRNRDTGDVHEIDWSMFLVRSPEGRVLGSAGMGRDVTAQVRAMADLEGAHAELARLYERTRELDAFKTQFFTKVSHELRTPLTLILAPLEKLRDALGPGDPRQADLDVVERNAQVLLRQVNNLLDAAKLEAGAMDVQHAEVDLAQEVRAVASFFASAAADAGITYAVRADVPVRAELDPEHVHRIVGNLLSNALKATPPGGTIRCQLTVDPAAAEGVIVVADSGPGVPVRHRAAVFERFRQLRPAGERRSAGTGLGLAIVAELAELHGGSVAVSDAPEGGAAFTVRLPLQAPPGTEVAPVPAAPESASTAPRPHPAAAPGTAVDDRPLVVVAEDNPDLNRLVCLALARQYRVVPAGDGEEALAAVEAHRPDLVVTDVMMPKLDGAELLRALRAMPEHATTPVLVLSARAEAGSRLNLLEAGASDYLAKPFTLQELRVRADNLVRAAQAQDRRRTAQIGRDRDRIATGLQEHVISELFAISMRLGGARGEATGRLAERLDEVLHRVDEVIRSVRETVFDPAERPTGTVRTS